MSSHDIAAPSTGDLLDALHSESGRQELQAIDDYAHRNLLKCDEVDDGGIVLTKCPFCGATGPNFDESEAPSDYCHHDLG